MKRIIFIVSIVTGLFLASCSNSTPDFVNSIPDNAVAVLTLHPMQLHSKGKVNSFESLKGKLEDEFLGQLLEDPLSSGLMLNEYTYVFMCMEEEAPVIGFVSGMRDVEKFEAVLGRIDEGRDKEFTRQDGYKFFQPDDEGIIAWNEGKAIVLGSPDGDEFGISFWQEKLEWMFNPVKEEALMSLVDFKDFQGKMQDINIWLSAEKVGKIAEKFGGDKIGDFSLSLPNNYSHIFFQFVNGAVKVTGSTNFSEDVQKNLDEVLVLNPSLNKDLLKMAPGGNLLMALSVSADLEKVKSLVDKMPDAKFGEVGEQIEEATGVPAETWINALTGDFTLAVNGLEEESMLPIEIFLGLGINDDELQKKMMKNVDELVTVDDEGDFFLINIQGNEIYSGIVHDTWVITNVKGYKDAVKSGKLSPSLLDSRFKVFSDGAMGMYVNLNLEAYPDLVDDLLEQSPDHRETVEGLSAPFDYLGISVGGELNMLTLKTTVPGENSLYTLLKLADARQKK